MIQHTSSDLTSNSTVLVTGGAGFIGSNLVDGLLAAGHHVIALDDLSSGDRSRVGQGALFVEGDIRDPGLSDLMLEHKIQAVFHLAAQVDVRKSVSNPKLDADINVLGTLNVGSAAARAGVKHVLFASTGGAIYGEPEGAWAGESHPLNPCSPYGIAKLSAEKYLQYLASESGFKLTILRFANVYGPRQDGSGEAGVVGIFLSRLLGGEDAVINGDGEQSRDFVYVADVVAANRIAFEAGIEGIYNVGTGEETSVNRLYELVAQAGGSTKPPLYAPGKPGEQRRSVLDPRLLGTVFGMTHFVPLADGLLATANWFRAERVPTRD